MDDAIQAVERGDTHVYCCGVGNVAQHRALSRAVGASTTLKRLVLRSTYMTDDAVAWWVSGVCASTTLQVLDLRCNGISSYGAARLARALKTSKTIRTFDLAYNNLSEKCARSIADLVTTSPSLESLDLSYNRCMSSYVISMLVRAAEDSAALEVLELGDCRVQNQVERALNCARARRALLGSAELLQDDGDHALAWRVARFLVSNTQN